MANLLSRQLQALLYAEGGVLSFKSLARSLDIPENDVRAGLAQLAHDLEESGLALVISDTEASLVIAQEARAAVVKVLKEDEEKNIGDAGLEILSILLYEGPSTRAEIDYVRGVNSSSTIRTLLSRGLVERSGNPEDGREYIYRPTAELLAHLGAATREDLPSYGIISPELAAFKAGLEHNGTGTESNTGLARD